MPHNIQSAAAYLTELFEPTDHIAVTLVHRPTAAVIQRTGLAHQIATEKYQRWLRFQNSKHYEVYACMNTIQPFSHGRKKADILHVRHLYLDFDNDGDTAVDALLGRTDLPHPNYVIQTSVGKYQIVWKVQHFTMNDAERLLRALAREAGADIAATDAARVLRLPGFFNHKYCPPHFVAALRFHADVFSPSDFPAYPTTSPTQEPFAGPLITPRTTSSDGSRSGQDWCDTLSRLRRGDDPQAVTNALIAARPDKSNPRYYAQRTVQRALALIAQTPTVQRA